MDQGYCVELDFTFQDDMSLGIESQLLLNWPRPVLAALPVSLSVSLVKCSGTLRITFDDEASEFFVSVLPLYELDLQVKSLLGNYTKLKDVPKIGDLICAKLRAWFDAQLVMPRGKKFRVPTLLGEEEEVEDTLST
jgi:maintenance of morphology protein 1